jgi:hypothetical protein
VAEPLNGAGGEAIPSASGCGLLRLRRRCHLLRCLAVSAALEATDEDPFFDQARFALAGRADRFGSARATKAAVTAQHAVILSVLIWIRIIPSGGSRSRRRSRP